MDETKYKHTQYGILMSAVFLIIGVLIGFLALAIIAEGRWGSAIAMLFLYLFGVASFYSLTIEVADEKLKFWFGMGVVQKTYFVKEIQSVTEIVNPWYYFWGVKSIPRGWFYAIAPGEALEIFLENGKIVQLGTNQSQKLKTVMELAMQEFGDK